MAEPIIMPKLGFDMAEGTLISWTIEIGQEVNKGDVIAEIETDKATIEIETAVGGTVLQLIGEPGDIVAVGSPIGYVGAPGETPPASDAPAAAPVEEELAVEAATSASAETPAQVTVSAAQSAATAIPSEASGNGFVKASPIARRLADERGLDLNQIAGSGPDGRITKKDVLNFSPDDAPAAPAPAPTPSAPAIPTDAARPTMPTFTEIPSGPDVEVEDLSRIRARIGQRLVESKQFVPHFYVTTEIDMAAALELRAELNETIEAKEDKISVNDLVVKAVALTLRAFPNLNSHYYGNKIVRHKRINIGIAVALDDGLVNVTSYDADKTALGTMATTHRDVITRARAGKVKPAELEGSTFTVSNLGPFDVDHFIAIINPPEAGILAVGSAKKIPVVLGDGSVGVGVRMKATISVDHRVSDGAEAAKFMQQLKLLLENPMRLLI